MLAASGAATGFLLLEFYRQSANAQVGRAEEVVSARAAKSAITTPSSCGGWRGSTELAANGRIQGEAGGRRSAPLWLALRASKAAYGARARARSPMHSQRTRAPDRRPTCRRRSLKLSGRSMLTRCAAAFPSRSGNRTVAGLGGQCMPAAGPAQRHNRLGDDPRLHRARSRLQPAAGWAGDAGADGFRLGRVAWTYSLRVVAQAHGS